MSDDKPDALDSELFAEAATPSEAPEPAPVESSQPRDDSGRFAPKEPVAEKPAAQPDPPPQEAKEQDDRQGIPAWRLREEAEAKREALKRAEAAEAERQHLHSQFMAMQQRLAQMEKPAERAPIPDPLIDPEGYQAHFERQLNDRLLNQQREFDMRMAHRVHGQVFEQAYAEAQQRIAYGDRQLTAMLRESASPGETMVQWYRQQKTMQEVGNDPNAWLEKKLEERLNDPAFLAKAMERARTQAAANPPSKPAVSLPPSLSSMSPHLAQSVDPDDGDNSDAAVFRQAFNRR